MNLFYFIPNELYSTIFTLLITGLCVCTAFYYIDSNENGIIHRSNPLATIGIIVLSIILMFFLGLRTMSYYVPAFGDSYYYYHAFKMLQDYMPPEFGTEWLWNNLNVFFRDLGDDEGVFFFLFVEICYIGFMLLSCIKISRKNLWISMLFCLASFSFLGYAVNGLRNGMACSILMFAITLISGNKLEKCFSIVLMVIAYSIHNSTILPIICCVAACTVIREPRYAIYFWGASIILSLIVGNTVGDFFASLGFDARTSYFEDVESSEYSYQFSQTGFRWDFLLYSSMPVLMAWYVTMKRVFKDNAYNIIATTYILANSFWVLVIRSTFSNRFAYLSWFIYPLVIVYPLLRMNIWEDQDRKTSLILLAYAGFTFFMRFM
ncbi:MAG: EpsG family protein [Muribaculaceae bacterium]|nr:EpsG family protein [Muribaculaceae bacterium]